MPDLFVMNTRVELIANPDGKAQTGSAGPLDYMARPFKQTYSQSPYSLFSGEGNPLCEETLDIGVGGPGKMKRDERHTQTHPFKDDKFFSSDFFI